MRKWTWPEPHACMRKINSCCKIFFIKTNIKICRYSYRDKYLDKHMNVVSYLCADRLTFLAHLWVASITQKQVVLICSLNKERSSTEPTRSLWEHRRSLNHSALCTNPHPNSRSVSPYRWRENVTRVRLLDGRM